MKETDVPIGKVTQQPATQAPVQQEDLAAIQAGIDDMEAGRVVAYEDVDARIRAKLGLPPGS